LDESVKPSPKFFTNHTKEVPPSKRLARNVPQWGGRKKQRRESVFAREIEKDLLQRMGIERGMKKWRRSGEHPDNFGMSASQGKAVLFRGKEAKEEVPEVGHEKKNWGVLGRKGS